VSFSSERSDGVHWSFSSWVQLSFDARLIGRWLMGVGVIKKNNSSSNGHFTTRSLCFCFSNLCQSTGVEEDVGVALIGLHEKLMAAAL
jgi:hypothetical protein